MEVDETPVLGSPDRTALASKLPPLLELPQPAGEANQGDDTAVVGSPGRTALAPKVPRFLQLPPPPAGEVALTTQ